MPFISLYAKKFYFEQYKAYPTINLFKEEKKSNVVNMPF